MDAGVGGIRKDNHFFPRLIGIHLISYIFRSILIFMILSVVLVATFFENFNMGGVGHLIIVFTWIQLFYVLFRDAAYDVVCSECCLWGYFVVSLDLYLGLFVGLLDCIYIFENLELDCLSHEIYLVQLVVDFSKIHDELFGYRRDIFFEEFGILLRWPQNGNISKFKKL